MKGKNRHIKLEQVYNLDNLRLADKNARKGKSLTYGPRKFDQKHEENLLKLREEIKSMTFKTMSPILELRLCDNKIRVLSKVYYRYHVAHHALMQIILPILERSYYYESSASIRGRGIHYTKKHIEKYIRTNPNKKFYQVQIDFVKFYPHIKRQKIYDRLCKEFTDKGIRYLLHDIIWMLGNHNGLEESDGTEGMGIGLYPTQPIINFYLNDLDRGISSIKGIKMYRYCDNILMISTSKKALEEGIKYVLNYADVILDQAIHTNYGIQPVNEKHPINFVGYKIYPTHTFIRHKTKYRFIHKCLKYKGDKRKRALASYKGWLGCCNGLGLWKKYTHCNTFNSFNYKPLIKSNVINATFKFIENNNVKIWYFNQIKDFPYIPKKVKPSWCVLMKQRQRLRKV